MLECCNSKKILPVLALLFVIAQIDLAASAGWPVALLNLLHLTPLTEDTACGVAAGLGCSLDVLVLFLAARLWARHALAGAEAGKN